VFAGYECFQRGFPKLQATLRALVGAPWNTAMAVFGLLPYDEWAGAKALGLARDGLIVDSDSGIRPVVPTELAREIIDGLQTQLATSTRKDLRYSFTWAITPRAESSVVDEQDRELP